MCDARLIDEAWAAGITSRKHGLSQRAEKEKLAEFWQGGLRGLIREDLAIYFANGGDRGEVSELADEVWAEETAWRNDAEECS